jgi:hypothetical protein
MSEESYSSRDHRRVGIREHPVRPLPMKKRAQEWQTITTAPRDGTPILVVLPQGSAPQSGLEWVTALFGKHVTIAAWTSKMPGGAPGWLTLAAATAILSGKGGAEDDIEPTHWSPLPPPASTPSSTSGGAGPQPEPFIATLPCSTRARAFLVKQGCRTRADLLKLKTLSDAEIGRWPKVGSKTVREIRTILDSITS